MVPVAELRPWDQNPRTISAERLKNLQRALAADPDFLRHRPILARRRDGVIYCGNQRYLAAVANGATEVPAIVEDVDERTMRERAIRDNEQWGEWSDGLGLVLRSLQGAGSDLGLLGLGDDHIERLLAAVLLSEAGEPPDLDLVPPEIATTQPGQLYRLGPHRLICGNSRDPEVWARLLGEERGDCMWTDPPYGVDLHVGGHSGDFASRLRERRRGPPARPRYRPPLPCSMSGGRRPRGSCRRHRSVAICRTTQRAIAVAKDATLSRSTAVADGASPQTFDLALLRNASNERPPLIRREGLHLCPTPDHKLDPTPPVGVLLLHEDERGEGATEQRLELQRLGPNAFIASHEDPAPLRDLRNPNRVRRVSRKAVAKVLDVLAEDLQAFNKLGTQAVVEEEGVTRHGQAAARIGGSPAPASRQA